MGRGGVWQPAPRFGAIGSVRASRSPNGAIIPALGLALERAQSTFVGWICAHRNGSCYRGAIRRSNALSCQEQGSSTIQLTTQWDGDRSCSVSPGRMTAPKGSVAMADFSPDEAPHRRSSSPRPFRRTRSITLNHRFVSSSQRARATRSTTCPRVERAAFTPLPARQPRYVAAASARAWANRSGRGRSWDQPSGYEATAEGRLRTRRS